MNYKVGETIYLLDGNQYSIIDIEMKYEPTFGDHARYFTYISIQDKNGKTYIIPPSLIKQPTPRQIFSKY